MFIGLEPSFCGRKQTLFLVILYRYLNLDLSVSLLFIRYLQFLQVTFAFNFR